MLRKFGRKVVHDCVVGSSSLNLAKSKLCANPLHRHAGQAASVALPNETAALVASMTMHHFAGATARMSHFADELCSKNDKTLIVNN
jgi:hypothetical protein